jgi:D-alanine--poly(phosphoribitol) ligase subunit 2
MEEKILSVLEELCGSDEVRRDRDVNLFATGLLDSFGAIELLVAIDEEFGIRIEPTELAREEFDTPNKIIGYVTKKGNQ